MIKTIQVEGIGDVIVARRKGTKNIKLSVSGHTVRLSIPYAVSEKHAMKFLASRQAWVTKHIQPKKIINDDDRIGRAHTLNFVYDNVLKTRSYIKNSTIVVTLPKTKNIQDDDVQNIAVNACRRALQIQAKNLLIQRVYQISKLIDIYPKSVQAKYMKSRWGHCSNRNDITLSSYLVQLPWELIDYVIIHELCHTVEHNHSKKFWALVEEYCSDYKLLKKSLKSFQPTILPNIIKY